VVVRLNENIYKDIITLSILICLFLIGMLLILKSNTWDLGSVESMNLAGSIISILSGFGLLIKFYINQKK
jgi:hypothetical protein